MRKVIAERSGAKPRAGPAFLSQHRYRRRAANGSAREVEVRRGRRGRSENHGKRFCFESSGEAAVKVPSVNASFDGDAIVQYADVDLGIAVAIEDGLLTPVIRAAQNKSLREISELAKELAHRARNKRMKPEEFQGGTFTVSNLGGMGIDSFSRHHQSAAGIHSRHRQDQRKCRSSMIAIRSSSVIACRSG